MHVHVRVTRDVRRWLHPRVRILGKIPPGRGMMTRVCVVGIGMIGPGLVAMREEYVWLD